MNTFYPNKQRIKVSPVLTGTRYAMVIFFDSKEKRQEQLARGSSAAEYTAAEHQYQPNARASGLLRKKKKKPVVVAWAAREWTEKLAEENEVTITKENKGS